MSSFVFMMVTGWLSLLDLAIAGRILEVWFELTYDYINLIMFKDVAGTAHSDSAQPACLPRYQFSS